MAHRKLKAIVGRAEKIDFPQGNVYKVPAKIDTGAWRTSVWASDIFEKDGKLHFTLLGEDSPLFSGKEITTKRFEQVTVENSFGHKEKRYSVHLKIKLGHKTVNTNVTLSDRSEKTYPVLIGRRLLKNRYVVDVAEGDPISDEEAEDS